MVRQHIKLQFSIPTKGLTCHFLNLKKKTHTHTHIPSTQLCFSHNETCYLKHGTKQNFFFLYEYCKHMFSQHFLNHNFHIILNNDTRNLQPSRPLILASLTTQFSKPGLFDNVVLVTLFIFYENTCR